MGPDGGEEDSNKCVDPRGRRGIREESHSIGKKSTTNKAEGRGGRGDATKRPTQATEGIRREAPL